MEKLHKDAGEIRKGIAHAMCDDGDLIYPDPKVVGQLFYACIDHHCIHMTQYEKRAEKAPSVESFGYLFKCVVRLLFNFVDAHPFGDGNGCMCRLLANHVLSLITPFPVALTVVEKEEVEEKIIWMLLLSVEATGARVQVHWLPC